MKSFTTEELLAGEPEGQMMTTEELMQGAAPKQAAISGQEIAPPAEIPTGIKKFTSAAFWKEGVKQAGREVKALPRRAALSFGEKKAKEEIKRIEKEIGTSRKFDLGDIADVIGKMLPLMGSIVGTPAGIPGMAVGAGAGEAVKQAIGRGLGVREEVPLVSEVTDVALTTGFTYVGGKAIQGISRYAASRFPKLLGIFAGESPESIKAALRNPQIADKAIQAGDKTLREAVKLGGERSIQLRTSFIKAHGLAFEKLAGKNTSKLVDRKELITVFEKMLKAKKVTISKKGLDFSISNIKANPGEISKIKAVYESIKSWKDFSLKGTNELKQLVGSLTKFADEAGIPSKSPLLGQFYHSIDDLIKVKLPAGSSKAYTEMNAKFSSTIDLFDDMVDAFNKGDPFTKIAQAMGKNKDSLRQVLEFYEAQSGQKIFPILGGRELGAEREAAFGFLNPREWVDLLISPQRQAKIITGIGKTQQGKIGAAAKEIYDKILLPFMSAQIGTDPLGIRERMLNITEKQ